MVDGELESEEEFEGLMIKAGYDTSEAREQALGEFRRRYPSVVKQGQRAFVNKVADELRKQIARDERSPLEIRRDLRLD